MRCGISGDPETSRESTVIEAFRKLEAALTEAAHTEEAFANESGSMGHVVVTEVICSWLLGYWLLVTRLLG